MFETSNDCTARCVMCGINEWRRKSGLCMEDWLFYKIANEIIEHASIIQKVALFVGNEPLLDKQLAKRISYLKTNGIKRVNFSTNGSLMDKARAKEILQSGVDDVNFSVDSLSKPVYEKMRRRLQFEEVLGNVLEFIWLRNSLQSQTAIRISIIKNKLYPNLTPFVKFWMRFLDPSLGDSVRIDELSYAVSEQGEQKAANKEDEPKAHAKLGALADLEYDKSLKRHEEIANLPCYILYNTLTIKADGEVVACCVDQGRKLTLGSLENQSIQEIWTKRGPRQKLMEQHLKQGRGSVEMCKTCTAWL